MKKPNATTIATHSKDTEVVLLRSTRKGLKVKTSVKAGVQKVREAA
jgi:hypothetical protein